MGDMSPPSPRPKAMVLTPAAKLTAGRKRSTDGEGAADTGSEKKKKKTDLDDSLVQCAKLRAKLLATQSKAQSLATLISRDPSWAWANNPGNLGALQESMGALATAISDGGVESLVNEDPRALRKSVGPDFLLAQCRRFLALADLCSQLDRAHSGLIRMMKARA